MLFSKQVHLHPAPVDTDLQSGSSKAQSWRADATKTSKAAAEHQACRKALTSFLREAQTLQPLPKLLYDPTIFKAKILLNMHLGER